MSKKSKKQKDPVLALMQTGVDNYKKECTEGKVPVPFAELLMGSTNVAYVVPAKPSDEENYNLVENAINPCVIASRLCTSEGRPYFTSRDNKIKIINHMRTQMSARTIKQVSYQIQHLAGEISAVGFQLLMDDLGLSVEGKVLKEHEQLTVAEKEELAKRASTGQDDTNDYSGYEAQDKDFDGDEPAEVTQTYPDENTDETGVQNDTLKTPSIARAEGNSEPPQP